MDECDYETISFQVSYRNCLVCCVCYPHNSHYVFLCFFEFTATPYQIKLGNTISNALYKLYMANGRPIETSLLIANGQISIAAIGGPDDDDEEEDYNDDDEEDYDYDEDDNEYDDVFTERNEEDDYSWRYVMDDLEYDSEDGDEKVGQWSNTTTDTGAEDPAAVMRGYNDGSGNRLEGEKRFRYLWNEWDPAGWMKLPLVSGQQDEKVNR